VELLGENVIKSGDFLFGEIILFASSIADQVQEQLEKGSLEIRLCLL
jgi:hypothetical protein